MSLELVFDEIPIELIDPSFFSFCLQTFVAIKIPPDEVVINATIVRIMGVPRLILSFVRKLGIFSQNCFGY